MLQGFVPLFMMTFCICLFIVMMQFLWRFIDDLVGKGLETSVIAELFFYAALTMVPMALPLAILLASLMLFGNLGERFELTAMKASGVSLIKVMSPLIVLLMFIAVGAFFFQNNVLPKAQVKMWTLLYSMRQKSPELDIPEGVFYDQITGYNLFVQQKNRETGVLYDLMIYDMSSGFNNASIILADSGKMSFSQDKRHLFLRLWQGESFENLKDQQVSRTGVPYRRESFSLKEILIPFDANFNRMDDSNMRNQYIGKDIAELQQTIDSVNLRIDSVGNVYGRQLQEINYVGIVPYENKMVDGKYTQVKNAPVAAASVHFNVDSVFAGKSLREKQRYVSAALERARQTKNEYEFKSFTISDDKRTIRRHQIEMQKKFTLSIACLIFFFIGAPLGAIIRKGGIGMPIVISVFLFIFYYIIDTAGYKMAREGRVEVWEGMWASTVVLLPLGIFLTYKAVNDSDVFKIEVYTDFFKRLFGRSMLRKVELKEVIMDDVDPQEAVRRLEDLEADCKNFLQHYSKPQLYHEYWRKGYDSKWLHEISAKLEVTVEYMSNSDKQLVINKLMDYPVLRSLWLYHPANNSKVGNVMMVVFPVGLACYFIGLRVQRGLKHDLQTVASVSRELIALVKE